MESFAWTCAIGGLVLGGLAALVPGFPGAAVALLGLAAFAGITGFEILGREALLLAGLIAAAGSIAQLAAPFLGARALGGTAGATTGAALGATLGILLPIPGFGLLGGVVGALSGGLLSASESFLARFRGAWGATTGCLVCVLADLTAVVALGALLALADFAAL